MTMWKEVNNMTEGLFVHGRVSRRDILLGTSVLGAGVGAAALAGRGWLPGAAGSDPIEVDKIIETNLGVGVADLNFYNGILVGREIWMGSGLMDPARVAAYDLDVGRVTKTVALPGVKGVRGIAHIGTELYVGTFTTGKIVRVDTVAAKIIDEVDVGEEVVWNVKASPDGKIFAGTYPKASLWEYDPESKEAKNLGRMSDETYVRDLAVTESTVYCGIGSHIGLVAYDRASGEISDVLPRELAEESGLTFVAVTEIAGDYLLAGTTPKARVAVIDTRDHNKYKIIKVPNDEPYVVGLYGKDDEIYIGSTTSNNIWKGRVDSEEIELIATGSSGSNRMGHLDDHTLWLSQKEGPALLDLQTGEVTSLSMLSDKLEAAPQPPQSMHWADGKLFVAGTGVMHVHQAEGKQKHILPTTGAVKDQTSFGGMLYTGHYTLSRFGEMPTSGNELKVVARIPASEQQTRPLQLNVDERAGKVLMASEPDYGQWEGALATMDMGTHEVETFRGILQDQSISAVCAGPSGAFVGGSVVNGYGTTPTRTTAQLGLFSYAKKTVTDYVDIPQTKRIVDLRYWDDLVYAQTAEGVLLAVDPNTLEVLWELQVAKKACRPTRIGDTMFGTDNDVIWAVTLGRTKPEKQIIVEGLGSKWRVQPTVSSDGKSALFTLRGFDLVRLDLPKKPSQFPTDDASSEGNNSPHPTPTSTSGSETPTSSKTQAPHGHGKPSKSLGLPESGQ